MTHSNEMTVRDAIAYNAMMPEPTLFNVALNKAGNGAAAFDSVSIHVFGRQNDPDFNVYTDAAIQLRFKLFPGYRLGEARYRSPFSGTLRKVGYFPFFYKHVRLSPRLVRVS